MGWIPELTLGSSVLDTLATLLQFARWCVSMWSMVVTGGMPACACCWRLPAPLAFGSSGAHIIDRLRLYWIRLLVMSNT